MSEIRLIDANALKEDMKSRLSYCNEWGENAKDKETRIRASAVKAFIVEVVMTINNAPTVEPTFGLFREMLCSECEKNCMECKEKRPQGEWIETQRGIHVTDYKCSCCGRTVMDDTGYDVSKDYPFCNCGADMRGDNNGKS